MNNKTNNVFTNKIITKSVSLEEKNSILQDIRNSFAIGDRQSAISDSATGITNIENNTVYKKLKWAFLEDKTELLDFIASRVYLEEIDTKLCHVLKTNTFSELDKISNTKKIIVNLHRINDFMEITRYFSRVNRHLIHNGIFVFNANTIMQRHNQFRKKYPYLVSSLFYPFEFIMHRVFPKIDFLKDIYFRLFQGRNRALSMTEILGRLYFCGFKVIDTIEINKVFYFLTMKYQEPIAESHSCYGPIIKMPRRGKNGKLINVYKFRTMHPYAEYLHSFLAEKYGYDKTGKLIADFRKTPWGDFLRKTWLDELPQLINILKGEMKLIGVRAFSDEYLKNYPPEFIKEREKYKPGCIPTYIALNMDKGPKERIRSEKIYLTMKKRHPLLTDMKFLWWAIRNMVARKVKG